MRSFARAAGRLAKTDAIDAATLRDFGLALHPKADPPPDLQLQVLAELVNARDKLVALRTTLTNSLEHAEHSLVRATFQSQVRLLSARIAKLDAAILASTAASSRLNLSLLNTQLLQELCFQSAGSFRIPRLGIFSEVIQSWKFL